MIHCGVRHEGQTTDLALCPTPMTPSGHLSVIQPAGSHVFNVRLSCLEVPACPASAGCAGNKTSCRTKVARVTARQPQEVQGSVTTKPTPDTVHSPTPGQLHVESIQLACTCALCCCYALCMKGDELLIFYSFWLRCFVVMMQYVGFFGLKSTFWKPSQSWRANLAVGARQLKSWRANCQVGAPTWRANS